MWLHAFREHVRAAVLNYPQSYLYTHLEKPQRMQEFETSSMSRQSVHESGKSVSRKHRPSLHLMIYPW